MTINRRRLFKSAFGAVALASGVQNVKAQILASPTPPDYARLSNAVLNSHGFAAGNFWIANSTGTLKSDDLVQAALLLRVTADHLEEIGVNTYIGTQLRQNPSGVISANAIHPIGEQFRFYGILMTDAEIQQLYYSPDPSTQQQALLDVAKVGVRGLQVQVADSLDVAAKKLRLLEIATACGGLLDQLSSPKSSLRAMHSNNLSPLASTSCSASQYLILGSTVVASGAVLAGATAPVGFLLGALAAYAQGVHYHFCG